MSDTRQPSRNERESLFEFRRRMEDELLSYAATRLREVADKAERRLARGAADREAAGGGDGLIPQSAAVPTPRASTSSLNDARRDFGGGL